jgi:hypothetical protein
MTGPNLEGFSAPVSLGVRAHPSDDPVRQARHRQLIKRRTLRFGFGIIFLELNTLNRNVIERISTRAISNGPRFW